MASGYFVRKSKPSGEYAKDKKLKAKKAKPTKYKYEFVKKPMTVLSKLKQNYQYDWYIGGVDSCQVSINLVQCTWFTLGVQLIEE